MRLSAAIAIAIRIQFVYANELAAIIGPVQFRPRQTQTQTPTQIQIRRYTDTDTGRGRGRETERDTRPWKLQPWPRAQSGVK